MTGATTGPPAAVRRAAGGREARGVHVTRMGGYPA